MIINTKFNLKDSAWYMLNNKPTNIIISAIEIFEVGTNQSHIKYNGKNITNSVSWLDHTNLFEGKLFNSKENLMKSLFEISGNTCKGINCGAVNGVGHSKECIKEHDAHFQDKANKEGVEDG